MVEIIDFYKYKKLNEKLTRKDVVHFNNCDIDHITNIEIWFRLNKIHLISKFMFFDYDSDGFTVEYVLQDVKDMKKIREKWKE